MAAMVTQLISRIQGSKIMVCCYYVHIITILSTIPNVEIVFTAVFLMTVNADVELLRGGSTAKTNILPWSTTVPNVKFVRQYPQLFHIST